MEENVFYATVSDVRPMASMLRALNFAPPQKEQRAIVEILTGGMKVTVEQGTSVQANAYLSGVTFDIYSFKPPESAEANRNVTLDGTPEPINESVAEVFEISLRTLLNCLNIFGNASQQSFSSNSEKKGPHPSFRKRDEEKDAAAGPVTAMRMSYAGIGEPLILVLEEGGTVTRCEIVTYDPDIMMDLGFDGDNISQKLIMKSEWLRDAFSEIDSSSEKLTLVFSAPDEPMLRPYGMKQPPVTVDTAPELDYLPTFRLEAEGTLGSTEMDYPNEKDVLEYFECSEPIRNTYKFSHMQLTRSALAASTKVSMRTSEEGILSLQFLIPLKKARGATVTKEGFVEFVFVPLAVE